MKLEKLRIKITIESDENVRFQKTTIYLQNKKPILIRKEIRGKFTAYLTNGDIETADLNYLTDFYVIDWQNAVYERVTPKEYIPIEETIDKKEIKEFINLANSQK